MYKTPLPDTKNIPDYLAVLNPEQRMAVLHEEKPLLILAGAGSGKTRVITTKIAYFIREKGINPWAILAVTFTNKAAKEMASRAAAIEPLAENAMLRTFHSFGSWFLRRNGNLIGLDSNFVIYDDNDMVSLLSTIMDGVKKPEVKMMAHCIARAKDYFFDPQSPQLDLINHHKEFRSIYAKYEERLAKTGNVDFGDLIKKPVEILRSNPNAAERLRNRFSVIMVDEYQDANIAQFELLKQIYGENTYLCVVGDDDQSIYRFRGAEVKNILEFPTRFESVDIIRLERNYRSTSHILDLADSVVKRNSGRLGKKLNSERGEGKIPELIFLNNQDEESAHCAGLIRKSVMNTASNVNYSDWAILYRTNAQSVGFENEFLRRKIPYKVVGSLKFYEREEIKDALALLSFLINPKDEISFRRVINKPARGIGAVTVERILNERWQTEAWNIEETIKRIISAFPAKAKKGLEDFLNAIAAGRNTLDSSNIEKTKKTFTALKAAEGLAVCVAAIIDGAALAEYHIAHDEIGGEQRIQNLQELVNGASIYPATLDGLIDFLERIELDRSIEQNEDIDDSVTLITVHNTKGLEFKNVIITGLEQGLFPRADKNNDELEEERRLFYVGATRAMDGLYLTYCRTRRMFGRTEFMEPSIFLYEADKNKLLISGEAPAGFKVPSVVAAKKNNAWSTGVSQSVAGSVSSDGRWALGDIVFQDDNGYGEIISIKETEDEPVIKVKFETGRVVQFLSQAQSSRFMKISKSEFHQGF